MVVNQEATMHIETGSIKNYINMTSKVTCHVNGNSFTNDLLGSNHVPMPSLSPLQDAATPEEGNGPDDEELTSLTWLQDNNLLRNLRVGTCENEDAPTDSDCAEDGIENLDADEVRCKSQDGPVFHLSHVPYNPLIHINAKPPYSFSCLIFMAIEDSPSKALPVKEIYSWIIGHFPYFQKAPTGWKNSVRHNLSLNKCFRKVDKDKGQSIGKGSLWSIDPEFRPNLLQAVKKIPYCPFSQFEDAPQDMKMEHDDEDGALASSNVNVPSPDLFPFLSKKLSVSSIKAYEVDAAATMLALKNVTSNSNHSEVEEKNVSSHFIRKMKRKKHLRFRPNSSRPNIAPQSKIRKHPSPIVITNPSEDHTYSAAVGETSGEQFSDDSTEGANETSDANHNKVVVESPPVEDHADEDLTLAEGAKALLSLARFAKNRRKNSRLNKRVSISTDR